jgi:hypothetical protein
MRPRLPLLFALLATACAGTPKPDAVAPEPPKMPPAATAPPQPPGPAFLPAQLLGRLDDEGSSPYFARRGDEGLVLYSAHGRWLARAVGADGTPKGAGPIDVAGLGSEPMMAALKPILGGGYLAVWEEPVAKNSAIKLLALDADGKAQGVPTLIAQVPDPVEWLDVLPNAKGALVVWDVPHDDRADVFVVPVIGGKVDGSPQVAAQGVLGWETEATERGAVLAMVSSDAGAPRAAHGRRRPARTADEASQSSAKLGKVLLAEIDTKGHASAPVLVSGEASAQIDITIAEVGGKYMLAWTDERNIDACVYLAVVEPGGKIATPPHRATSPFGEQALVSLVAEAYVPGGPRSKRALLAWEDQIRAPRESRLIHLATVGADGTLGKERSTLVFSASGPPDLQPDGEGFAAMTLAPVHDPPEGVTLPPGPSGEAPVWPAYVRFAPDLHIVASEPVRTEAFADTDGVPYLTRWLTCSGGKCTTLSSGAIAPARAPDAGGDPGAAGPPAPAGAPLMLVSLPTRESPWKHVALREADEAPPRPASVSALFDGDHLARVAAAELPGGGALSAWVTYVLESTSRGKRIKGGGDDEEGQAATLGVRAVGPDGAAGKPVTVSTKAVSIGGVALAAAPGRDPKKPETALAWVGRVRGEPQVFVTKLGPDGEKLGEKAVTTLSRKPKKKFGVMSEASDVAIAWAGEGGGADGFITAWSDSRDGNAEIYVSRVDRALNKVVPERRLTEAPGESSEPQIAVRGKDVFVVWSDARAKPDEGSGDIYVARLDAATLKKTGPETRIFASAAHSRTPQILPVNKGFVVAWIEESEGPKGSVEPDAGLRLAILDEKGVVVGAPVLVHGADAQGAVTSAALACTRTLCRGVLTSVVGMAGEALVLGAFEWTPGQNPGAVKTIAALKGSSQDVSPAFSGPDAKSLFFADDSVSSTGRVRWMQIAWP